MRLPFIEMLELEHRVALITLIVKRMGELGLLSEEAAESDPSLLARQIVGTTDMDATGQWAMVNAAVSLVGRAAEACAVVTSDKLVPAIRGFGRKATAAAHRSRYISQVEE